MSYIASIGFFDGVHIGHLSLINQLRTKADETGVQSMLITFTNHPRQVTEGVTPPLLLSHDERLKCLQQAGVDRVVELDFQQIHSLTAETFMRQMRTQYEVEAILMGYDHRFGSDRLNKLGDYQVSGAKAGVQVYIARQAAEGAISSTKIRRALEEGRLEEANEYLGYNYTLTGEVIHGQHIGTDLGFPTANIAIANGKLIPQSGVYAAIVRGKQAIVNIGTNPTFGEGRAVSIEVHIPNFSGDLYGETLVVELTAYLRKDQRFDSRERLINQIRQDITHLAQLLQ